MKPTLGIATAMAFLPTVGATQGVAQRDTAPLIAFRIAHLDSAADRDRVVSGDSVLFISRTVLLSDADLLSVRPGRNQAGELILNLNCSLETSERFSASMKPYVSKYLAVMVEGRFITAPIIMAPVGCRGIPLNTYIKGGDAERIRDLVIRKWSG